jgi:hypothetical protein
VPEAGKRHLHVAAEDAGSFLRSIDVVQNMEFGRLNVDATFESATGFHPIAGTMDIEDIRIKKSPILGKLLQAVSLYGLIEAVSRPGMAISHLIIPFQYDGETLVLQQARAYNMSLGITAKGYIRYTNDSVSISGTIVPAYFFNTMLGRLPFIGKLFSPEAGGGLFAARYRLDGPLNNMVFSINPVSALTPGFLREIFDVFGDADPIVVR